jgi:hypothetical protein
MPHEKLLFLFLLALLVSAAQGFAQITTSAICGKVVDTDGMEIIGATVVAVHTPSGTSYGTATNASGYFTIQGMRLGGSYEVEVDRWFEN